MAAVGTGRRTSAVAKSGFLWPGTRSPGGGLCGNAAADTADTSYTCWFSEQVTSARYRGIVAAAVLHAVLNPPIQSLGTEAVTPRRT